MAFSDVALASLALVLATSAGAAVVLFMRCPGRRTYSAMLAFAAGMMAFSSVEMLGQSHGWGGDLALAGGLVLGIASIAAAERMIPHIHRHFRHGEMGDEKKKAVLVFGSIAIHNVPEGFAVASAFSASPALGWFITATIAAQDVPEGAMASAPLACYGMEAGRSMKYGVLTGVAEAAAAIISYIFLSAFGPLVPFALSFSAGAMAYVVLVELLPDAMRRGTERVAAGAFIAGVLVAFGMASLLAF